MAERKRYLDDYETVQERIAKFYAKYPQGRILTELTSDAANWEQCRYKALLYRNFEDDRPLATGHATESVEGEKNVVNKAFHEENAESSAIGRALANAGFFARHLASAPEAPRAQPPQEEPTGEEAVKSAPAQSRAEAAHGDHPVLQIIWDKAQGMGITPKQMKAYLMQEFGVPTSKALSDVQIAQLAEVFEQVDTLDEFGALMEGGVASMN